MENISELLKYGSPEANALQDLMLETLRNSGIAAMPANVGLPDLSTVLRLMQEGVVSKPMWFMSPENMRSVVMIPLDITAMTPALNKQLADLMAVNAARSPRNQ